MSESYASLIDFASCWADTKIAITPYGSATLEDGDISAVKHGGKVSVGKQKKGGRTVARTSGSVEYDASVTFYRSGLKKVVQAFVDAAPDYAIRGNQVRISLVIFDFDIHHSPPGQPGMQHVRIKGCRLLEYSDDMSEGDDADTIDLTLDPIENVNVLPDGREVVLL